MLVLRIAFLLVKNVCFGVKKGISELAAQKYTAHIEREKGSTVRVHWIYNKF